MYHAIYKNKLQSRNFIIDISNSNMTIRNALLQLKKIYNRLDTNFVNKIVIKKNQKFIIYKKGYSCTGTSAQPHPLIRLYNYL